MNMNEAAIKIQSRARAFLAVRRKASLIKNKIICSFIFKKGENFAHVMVKYKLKKKKYKILVRNVRANRHLTTKVKIQKFPVEHAFLKEYLLEAL